MLLFAQDNFNRPDQSGFGTASDGSTWSVISGAATPAISGNEGVVNGVSAQTFIQLGSTTSENAEALVKLSVPSVNYLAIGIFLRSIAGNTAYRFRLNSNNSGQGIGIIKTVAGASTNLVTGAFTVNLNTFYWVRAFISGTNLSMKAWEDGTPEPGSWTLTTTDNAITGPGGVGVVVNTPQTADTARFDDFSAGTLTTILDYPLRGNIGLHPLLLGQDNFTRPNQSGFGSTIDGDTWEYLSGDQAATITSNAGQITSGSGTATFLLGNKVARDMDILIRAKSTADEDHFGISARLTDPNTQYRIYWTNDLLTIQRELSDIKTTLATGAFTINGVSHNNFYWVRAQVFGETPTTLRAKIWLDGTGEPGAWTVTTSDTNPLTSPGRHGLHLSTELSANVVVVNSYLALSLTPVLHWPFRAGLSALGQLDWTCLARLGGFPTSFDYAFRGILAGLGQYDYAFRGGLAEPPIPLPITPNASYTIKIGGQVYRDQVDSFTLGETIDGRTTLSFAIKDAPGTLRINERMPVIVEHSVRGEIFRGFVDAPEEENLTPNPTNHISITCIDDHWLAEKRVYELDDFEGEYTGVVAAHMAKILEEEGLENHVAIHRDTTLTDFSQGTLDNVVAVPSNGTVTSGDGALELAPAGETVSIAEGTFEDFNAGTLTDLEAAGIADSGYLSLESRAVLKYSATCTIPGGGDLLCMHKVWSGSQSIAAGDALGYWVWVSSSSPQIKAGVDFTCTDGTTLRNAGIVPAGTDQHGISPSPNEDLAGLADDQWCFRRIGFTLPGKTISNVSVGIGGDEPGDYTAYFRLIVLLDSFGAVKTTFFDGTLQTSPTQVANNGYINAKLEPVTAYLKEGTRVSPAYPLTQAGIARNSLIAWSADIPEDVEMKIETSLDLGATWQICESFQSLPALLPGTALIGRSLMLRETIINNSPDPTRTAKLHTLNATIQPSFNATKQDNVKVVTLDSDWLQGTLTSLVASSDSLHLNQFTRNWDNAIYSDQDTFGNFATFVFIKRRQIGLQSDFEEDCRSRIDAAGQWQNFTAEVDINLQDSPGDAGLVYRTTGWQDNNDTYAYAAYFSNSIIALARGTNSAVGSGSKVVIASQPLTLDSGNWHRLKVEVSGSNHKIYLDDVLFINANDSTFTGAGFIGLRHNNTSIDTIFSVLFDNFGVSDALSGTWLSPAHDLSSVGTCYDSYVAWDTDTPGNSTILIEVSIDNGATWATCANGVAIPGLVRGMNLGNMSFTGINLQVRATLSTPNASVPPVLRGLTTAVIGRMQASGFRIGEPLSLSPVGRVGSSIVSWSLALPSDETDVGIDVSSDGQVWTQISDDGTGGVLTSNSVPFLRGLSEVYRDSFDEDRGVYSLVSLAGGGDATWETGATNSRLTASGGISSFYRYNDIVDFADGEILFDSDRLDNGGVCWRLDDASMACYLLSVSDNLLTGEAGVARLYRVSSGMQTQLGGSALIPFRRGKHARLKVVMTGGDIAISIDGISILNYTDLSPLQAGYLGLVSNGGLNQYSQWRVQQYGQEASGLALYTRTRLSSSDPLASPQVLNLTSAVMSPEIALGKQIPTTTYSIANGAETSLAQNLDDLADQSGDYWWRIKRRRLIFQPRTGIPAPFVLSTDDIKIASKPKVKRDPTLYRNEQVTQGGTDVIARVDKHIAQGGETFFQTSDPIESVSRILINGQAVSFGLQGVDEDKQWFYQEGEKGITRAEGGVPLVKGQEIVVESLGRFPVIAKARADGQIVLLAAIDETSGIVTKVERVDGLGLDAAIEVAIARLQQYAKLVINFSFETWKPGLEPGQLLTVFVPQHGLNDIDFLITDVGYAPTPLGNDNLTERFTVNCTSGPIVGQWEHLFS